MRSCWPILFLTCLTTGPLFAAEQRPNVLFIVSDDLNNLLGTYGDPLAKTPNLDKLASRGVRFDRAYCSFPLCGPSRNSFLTGLYPNSTGILSNGQVFRQTIPSHRSLPQAFRNAGYFAGRIGKLYHYNVPTSVGTNGHDDPGSWELELNPAGVDRLVEEPQIFSVTPGQFGASLSWYASPKGDRDHTDGLMADDAEWVLERFARRKDRPFFLAVGFFRPHTPYVAPKPYFDLHPESTMPVIQGVEEDLVDIPIPARPVARRDNRVLDDAKRRQARQAYNASISFMDAQVGRVVDALDRLGLSENTIIVFISDHGYHVGEHGLWQKMSLFEESARVPLLIVAPGLPTKGRVAKTPVSLVDLYPTLAELSGVERPTNLQGQSLVPILKDPDAVGRGWAITQVTRGGAGFGPRPGGGQGTGGGAGGGQGTGGGAGGGQGTGRGAGGGQGTGGGAAGGQGAAGGTAPTPRFFGYSIRTPRWRYTEWDEGRKGRELYDHDVDPRELTNLAEKSEHASTVEALSQQLHAAVKTTFPPDGHTPEIRPGPLWSPNLTNP
ncbi:sulfatase [Aquisphaera insulae]|uniref:sulfatase n=1 Tax=Aquisphaera insulae TaxID=2712864 RepID=UPI00196ABFFD|nr:sulfatase [Aquisphaera insulae]